MGVRVSLWGWMAALQMGLRVAVTAAQIVPAADPMALGKQELQHQQWSEAQAFFANYLRDNPGSVEAKFYLGNAALGAKRYDEAEKVYKEIIATYPRMWSAHSNLSEIYAAQERWPVFEQERQLLQSAKEQHEEGTERIGNDVIDVLHVGDQAYIVHEYYPLSGRFHTRYDFLHFGADGKLDRRIACESDDIDQVEYAKRHPKKAAAGERSFSLDGYSTNTHSTILFYSEGEPRYAVVRADVLRSLTGKAGPLSTTTVNGITVPAQPDVPKEPAPPK